MTEQALHEWQIQHEESLVARLAPLLYQPDGVLAEVRSPLHTIRITKHADQIHFYFVDPDGALDGPMSRIDLRQPLHLIAEYAQTAMLGLLWVAAPQRACVIGLAGGRLSLVLYHYLPSLIIDNLELDPAIAALAERFFGITFDQRQRLLVGDAAELLSNTQEPYDLMIMDAFRDSTDQLDHLATEDFYQKAKQHMRRLGVFVVNMLASDPMYQQKLTTFGTCFHQCFGCETKHGAVVFGVDSQRISRVAITGRAVALQTQHDFSFDLGRQAAKLMPLHDLVARYRERSQQ